MTRDEKMTLAGALLSMYEVLSIKMTKDKIDSTDKKAINDEEAHFKLCLKQFVEL